MDPDYQAGYAVGKFIGALLGACLLSIIPWTIAHRRQLEGYGKVAVACIFATAFFLPPLAVLAAIVFTIFLAVMRSD